MTATSYLFIKIMAYGLLTANTPSERPVVIMLAVATSLAEHAFLLLRVGVVLLMWL